jgi:hypothetical protein
VTRLRAELVLDWNSIPGRDRCFSIPQNVFTNSEDHPGSYPKGAESPLSGLKTMEFEADLSIHLLLVLLLRVLQSMANLGVFYCCSPLAPIL